MQEKFPLIEDKEVDIYQYPDKFEEGLEAITMGDLHGNLIKLLYFLFRNRVLHCKESPVQTYQQFVALYEEHGETLSDIRIRSGLNEAQLISLKKLIIEEDTIWAKRNQLVIDFEKWFEKQDSSNQEAINLAAEKLTQDVADLELEFNSKEQEILRYKSNYFTDNEFECFKASLVNVENFCQMQVLHDQLSRQVQQFKSYLEKLEVTDQAILVRLIGDETGDRGFDDFFTLLLLAKLKEPLSANQSNKILLTILFSNHGNEFVEGYEKYFNSTEFFTPKGGGS